MKLTLAVVLALTLLNVGGVSDITPSRIAPDTSDSAQVGETVPADTAADSVETEPRCIFRIDRLLISDGDLHDTLDIMVESAGFEMGGCLLKIGIRSSFVDIVEILPGEMIDSCGWHLFRADEVRSQNPESASVELWQITTLAQSFSGGKKPLCYRIDRPVSLARVVVSSVHVPVVPDTTAAVFFYWESCRDNVVSDRKGASILVSDTVYDCFSITPDADPDQFPTRHGTPPECISPHAAHAPRRLVEFYNGGVAFKLDLDRLERDSVPGNQ